jgi:hypothetical protein
MKKNDDYQLLGLHKKSTDLSNQCPDDQPRTSTLLNRSTCQFLTRATCCFHVLFKVAVPVSVRAVCNSLRGIALAERCVFAFWEVSGYSHFRQSQNMNYASVFKIRANPKYVEAVSILVSQLSRREATILGRCVDRSLPDTNPPSTPPLMS